MVQHINIRGGVVIVDDQDVALVRRHSWFVNKSGYVDRRIRLPGGVEQRRTLHRTINETPDGLLTDHIDGDRLNNQRANLRSVTAAENAWNRKKHHHNTSGYKGVTFHQPSGRWYAYITKSYKRYHLGQFDTPDDAARAYAVAAHRLHGSAVRQSELIT